MRQEDRNVLHNMGCTVACTPGRVALLALLLKNGTLTNLECAAMCCARIVC
jgi:hypothetical protein